VEAVLQSGVWRRFLAHLYGNRPERWDDGLEGDDRLRAIVNAMTRLRVCTREGAMDLAFKGEPGEKAPHRIPWFEMPDRANATHTIVCGHWSALGLQVGPKLLSLDSGCVWGRSLTAVRLADRRLWQAPCPGSAGRED
jgi:bis(5'-nucleosyl)-tetraphosphatase (symmetrical)